jgi:hypothetical protein
MGYNSGSLPVPTRSGPLTLIAVEERGPAHENINVQSWEVRGFARGRGFDNGPPCLPSCKAWMALKLV